MPFCPTCRTEYRAGFDTCADCGAQLVEALDPVPPQHTGHEADVVVARASSQPLAQMWAELLGSHGISCRIAPVNPGDSVYVPSQALEIRVPAVDAVRAQELLPVEAHTAVVEEREDEDEEAEALVSSEDRVETGLRWIVIVGVALVVLVAIAAAVRCSVATGRL